ncbi:MAG: hypothetical protein K6U14_05710 [Firmicutes bacterium]|nr:hypothetical protein [Alicyclobacillaceae bacterium]MCL6497115.1 hypothetical protein [Bacillota bacterium]
MGEERRVEAVTAIVQALRTGERAAATGIGEVLAESVTFVSGNQRIVGRSLVAERLSGQWPMTPALMRGGFSEPAAWEDGLAVEVVLPELGAAPAGGYYRFRFDEADRVVEIREELTFVPAQPPTAEIPLYVRGIINSALANGTPMVVAYTAPDGQPKLSLRGSVQVYSPTELCLWARRRDAGLAVALATRPLVSLLYRDSRTRTTLVIEGEGRVAEDEATRERVFRCIPEVEQRHDPERRGAAVLIAVRSLRGTTPRGAVTVTPNP